MSSGRSSYSLFHFAHNVGCPNISLSMIRNVVPEKISPAEPIVSGNAGTDERQRAAPIARSRGRNCAHPGPGEIRHDPLSCADLYRRRSGGFYITDKSRCFCEPRAQNEEESAAKPHSAEFSRPYLPAIGSASSLPGDPQ